uniref:Uncharacterized protein n=1 Tax=Romanomermis culicivorax TaxID=13658 RepID=A0A915KAW5_ROMCU
MQHQSFGKHSFAADEEINRQKLSQGIANEYNSSQNQPVSGQTIGRHLLKAGLAARVAVKKSFINERPEIATAGVKAERNDVTEKTIMREKIGSGSVMTGQLMDYIRQLSHLSHKAVIQLLELILPFVWYLYFPQQDYSGLQQKDESSSFDMACRRLLLANRENRCAGFVKYNRSVDGCRNGYHNSVYYQNDVPTHCVVTDRSKYNSLCMDMEQLFNVIKWIAGEGKPDFGSPVDSTVEYKRINLLDRLNQYHPTKNRFQGNNGAYWQQNTAFSILFQEADRENLRFPTAINLVYYDEHKQPIACHIHGDHLVIRQQNHTNCITFESALSLLHKKNNADEDSGDHRRWYMMKASLNGHKPNLSTATDICRGCSGHVYKFRSSSGNKSTSWKMKHCQSYSFLASTKPTFNNLALLNV